MWGKMPIGIKLYFALGIIALSFLVTIVSNRTYIAPAGRDLEIAPTNVGASVRLETAPTGRMSRSGESVEIR